MKKQQSRGNGGSSSSAAAAAAASDPRFSAMHSAPTFKKVKKDSKKVQVDDRFKQVLTDERFRAVPGAVDSYGRKNKGGGKAAAEELSSFYHVEESAESKSKNDKPGLKTAKGGAKSGSSSSGGKGDEAETRLEYLNRLARGDVDNDDDSSSSSSESNDSEDEGQADQDDEDDESEDDMEENSKSRSSSSRSALAIPDMGDEMDDDEIEEGHATTRLAIQNCDWDNVRASDLLVVLQSFCPAGHNVKNVTVYPSDFGKEQMAKDAMDGPRHIWNKGQLGNDEGGEEEEEDEEEEDDEEGDEEEEEEGDEEEEEEGDEEVEEDEDDESNSADESEPVISRKAKKAARKGDFVRQKGERYYCPIHPLFTPKTPIT